MVDIEAILPISPALAIHDGRKIFSFFSGQRDANSILMDIDR